MPRQRKGCLGQLMAMFTPAAKSGAKSFKKWSKNSRTLKRKRRGTL